MANETEKAESLLSPAEDERATVTIYRVSALMLAVMQRELPREPDGKIHTRLAIATIGAALARWLAVGASVDEPVEKVIDWTQREIRELMIKLLTAERERIAEDAAERGVY